MRTFKYTGDGDQLLALGHTLKKGGQFATDDPALIELLTHTANVEEVKQVKVAEIKKSPSPKPDAERS